MIILGDISVPTQEHVQKLSDVLNKNSSLFAGKHIVLNLEGLISEDESILKSSSPVVFNHPDVIRAFRDNGTVSALLANNHTLDLPKNFKKTVEILNNNQVSYIGAALSQSDACKPLFVKEQDVNVIFLNYCWDFLLYHQKNPSSQLSVSVYQEKKLIQQVIELKQKYPNHRLAVYFHWSFDLETLPFPAYRTFAQSLIDHGADLIVGCHSHCVQGGEVYKEGNIVYGLGNFYFPNGEYVNGNLKFPSWANETLAIEWDVKSNQLLCHWFNISGESSRFSIEYAGTENFGDGNKINQYSPFRDMDYKSYLNYFKLNRRKKKLIPVLKHHEDFYTNRIKIFLLKLRAKTARSLAKLKLIKWQN